METLKICTKCGKELPATTEYFQPYKNGKGIKLYLRGNCRTCRTIYLRNYRNNNKDIIKNHKTKYQNTEKYQICITKYRNGNGYFIYRNYQSKYQKNYRVILSEPYVKKLILNPKIQNQLL